MSTTRVSASLHPAAPISHVSDKNGEKDQGVLREEKSNELIVERLKKLGTEQISDIFDALGIKNKIINGISPLKETMQVCGRAYTVLFSDMSDERPQIGEQNRFYLDNDFPDNTVLMIENAGRNDCSVWGGLLSRYAEKKGISGTIMNGSLRDANQISRFSSYPVFSTAETCSKSENRCKVVALNKAMQMKGVEIVPGEYVLADRSGVVAIDPLRIEEVLGLAEKKQLNEKRIAEYIDQGYSLVEIDKMMKEGKSLEAGLAIANTK